MGSEEIKNNYGISGPYLIYIGAIQPRKNLDLLVKAFGEVKKDILDLKLVLVGEKAWLSDAVFGKIENIFILLFLILFGSIGFIIKLDYSFIFIYQNVDY